MRFGIIGCGKVATDFHLPALSKIKNVDIVSLSDLNSNTLRRLSKKYNVKDVYINYKEMLLNDDIDSVIISTPPQLHAEMVIEAAKRGKNIIVEKPFTLTKKEAIDCIDVIEKNGVNFTVVHNYRYYPVLQHCKTLVEKGIIGKITNISGIAHIPLPLGGTKRNWLFNDENGVIYDFGPHLFDALNWFMDSPPIEVTAYGGDFLEGMGCDNSVQVLISFQNGSTAFADLSWLDGISSFEMNLSGTGGHIHLDVFRNHFMKYHMTPSSLDFFSNSFTLLKSDFINLFTKEKSKRNIDSFIFLIEDFIQNIDKEKDKMKLKQELATVSCLDAAKSSLKLGKSIKV